MVQAGRVENYPVLRARVETHITETQLAGMVAADEIVKGRLLCYSFEQMEIACETAKR
ncbi:hypothetical protein RM190_23165 [Paracoccus sp. CPCC 101403]|uniref:Uncharacterized protein n=1 Tax=Paracoccus broussonetiae TaxID=3075834 RepID=A0ABU3EKJ3_9RHOB|nr:hypothetical protein [Paracoccus sp. CPCC 101403]MDT1064769.1 hypothetical protein [Paracoccus sp. CPCC 101403]